MAASLTCIFRMPWKRLAISIVGVVVWATVGRTQVLTTVVGGSVVDGAAATATPLSTPKSVLVLPSGDFLVAETAGDLIRRVEAASGLMRIIAGGGTLLDDRAGVPARSARFFEPDFLIADPAGNILFSDTSNHRVRKLTAAGAITTVAGDGVPGFSGDGGPAVAARLNNPRGLALDSSGNLYIADSQNFAIRRVDAAGNISTFAGQPGRRCPPDTLPASPCGDGGPALSAQFTDPAGLALEGRGRLLVADFTGRRVRRIDLASGLIQLFAGAGVFGFFGDGGPALLARFATPNRLAVDGAGNVYISDEFNHRVRMVRADSGIIVTVAGGGDRIGSGFPAVQTALAFPTGLFLDGAGNLWVMDGGNGLVRRMNLATGIMTTVAGTLDVSDGGPALRGSLSLPRHIRFDAGGNLYIADESHHRVRKISAGAAVITTIAGNGIGGFSGDNGPATGASLLRPFSTAVDGAGNVYIADTDNHRIRRVDGRTGIITTIAGTGQPGFFGDGGPAVSAQLFRPLGLLLDRSGGLLICEADRVRRVDLTTGLITTVAGREQGFAGDGGPAIQARLFQPTDLALTSQGHLLIADTRNQVVRRVDARTGIITTLAGTPGVMGYTGDGGPARLARLFWPVALTVDRSDNIYVAEFNGTVRKIAADGIISTVAGTGLQGFSPDGTPAPQARLILPFGLGLDGAGTLYIVELANRVRALRFDIRPAAPALRVAPSSLDFQVQELATSPATRALQVSNANFGPLAWNTSVSTASGGNWLSVSPASGAAPSAADVVVNPAGLEPGTYRGTITVSGAGAADSPQVVPVEMIVSRAAARLAVSSGFLTFQATEGRDPPPQAVAIQNTGSGSFSWTAAASTRNAGAWLTVSDTSGTAPHSLNIIPRVSGLRAGSYQGQVVVTRTGSQESASIEVVLLVASERQPVLEVSQNTFSFYGAEGALTIPSQNLLVLNSGQGTLLWSAEVINPGGGDWLRATAAEGAVSLAPARTGRLELQARPGALRAGVYSALVLVRASGAKNSPQAISVRLRIQPPGVPPRALLDPGGLAFQAAEGASNPLVEAVRINTTGGETSLSFSAQPFTESGGAWLSVTPQASVLFGSSETATMNVQVNPEKLAAGPYRGRIAVSFSNGVVETIPLLVVVTPAGVAAQGRSASGGTSSACTPTRQFLAVRHVRNTYAQVSDWASQLFAQVRDNCGGPVATSSLVAKFSNGDPPVVLRHQGDGVYSAPWVPRQAAPQVDITFEADDRALGRATARYTASVASGTAPRIGKDAILHGASFSRHLAPGALVSLFGENLASQVATPDRTPLPTELANLSVKIGDRDAPLLYVGPQQVNLQIPWEVGESTISTVVVSARGVASAGEFITIETAQPGIFSLTGDGRGQGAILNARSQVVNESNPAAPGEILQIFAAGLGATSPPARTGEPAPSDPLSVLVTPVRCTIGGVEAPVHFQGLAPGFVGLYQVNVEVPAGAPAGPAVPVVLVQNGISSNTVTIAVR